MLDDEKPPTRLTCRDCGETFSANGGGHCRGCCRTFRSDSAFDQHRRGPYDARVCLDVLTIEKWRLTPRGWTNAPKMEKLGLGELREYVS